MYICIHINIYTYPYIYRYRYKSAERWEGEWLWEARSMKGRSEGNARGARWLTGSGAIIKTCEERPVHHMDTEVAEKVVGEEAPPSPSAADALWGRRPSLGGPQNPFLRTQLSHSGRLSTHGKRAKESPRPCAPDP